MPKEKLLYVSFPELPFTLPGVYPGIGGGMYTLERFTLETLKEEFDVTVLASEDTDVNPLWDTPVIKGGYKSKIANKGRREGAKMAKDIFRLAPEFDKIFLNDFKVGRDLESWKKIANKSYFVNHSSLEGIASSFLVSLYHFSYILSLNGAKIAHVQENLEEELRKILPKIEKNPYLIRGYPVGEYEEKFHFINLRVTDPLFYEGDIHSGENWVVVGRCDPFKRISKSVEAWQKSGVKGGLEVFTILGSDKELQKILSMSSEDPRITVKVGASREEISRALKGARGSIFISKSESMGLVALESVLCGTPVVYSNPSTHCFMEKTSFSKYSPNIKDLPMSIRDVDSSLVVKEKVREEALKVFSPLESKKSLLEFVRS